MSDNQRVVELNKKAKWRSSFNMNLAHGVDRVITWAGIPTVRLGALVVIILLASVTVAICIVALANLAHKHGMI